jgi:hypothetical protein
LHQGQSERKSWNLRKHDEEQSFNTRTSILLSAWVIHSCSWAEHLRLPHQLEEFNFCLTTSGTIVSLPGILASSNPVEGWEARISDINGGHSEPTAYPGLGISNPAATVSQPHGPGTLPITFDPLGHGFGLSNTFTAEAAAKTITIKTIIKDCASPQQYCRWYGWVHRAANIRIDDNLQNYFGSSTNAAIAYRTNGVALSGVGQYQCSGIVPDVSNTIGVLFYGGVGGCGAAQPTTLQQGAVFSEVGFDTGNSGHTSVITFTYKLF